MIIIDDQHQNDNISSNQPKPIIVNHREKRKKEPNQTIIAHTFHSDHNEDYNNKKKVSKTSNSELFRLQVKNGNNKWKKNTRHPIARPRPTNHDDQTRVYIFYVEHTLISAFKFYLFIMFASLFVFNVSMEHKFFF